MAGYVPEVPFDVPSSSQKMHVVWTEDSKGWGVLVVQCGRQNSVDVPEACGAIV